MNPIDYFTVEQIIDGKIIDNAIHFRFSKTIFHQTYIACAVMRNRAQLCAIVRIDEKHDSFIASVHCHALFASEPVFISINENYFDVITWHENIFFMQ